MPRPAHRFADWTASLASDVNQTFELLTHPSITPAGRRTLCGTLSLLVTHHDLIADDSVAGFVDDAMVLRIGYSLAAPHATLTDPALKTFFDRLRKDENEIGAFLGGTLTTKLRNYVERLGQKSAHGRTPDQILSDDSARAALKKDIDQALTKLHPMKLADDHTCDEVEAIVKDSLAAKLERY